MRSNARPGGTRWWPELSSDGRLLFAAYNVVGAAIGALGSLSAGLPAAIGVEALAGYRGLMWAYAASALLLLALFSRLSPRVEAPSARAHEEKGFLGVRRSRGAVAKLAALFALDSLGSGFVVQGIVAYWFNLRFGIDIKGLGAIAFGTDALAALSFLAAPWVAGRVGLLKAAILPQLVANALGMLVPLMP